MQNRILRIVKKTAIGSWTVQKMILGQCVLRTKWARLFGRGPRDWGNIQRGRGQRSFNLLHKLSADGYPTYFGYYDKSPFEAQDRLILAMSLVTRRDDRAVANWVAVRLGYFEWAEVLAGRPQFHTFGESSTWSWQQGCMLQWYPSGMEGTAVCNRLVANRYGSVVQEVATKNVLRELPFPLFALDPSGSLGVSLNLSRLDRLDGIDLQVDGHPSLSLSGEWLLTDSYPDRFGDQGLYLYSLSERKTTRLGTFYSPCRFRGFLRCDLHPRWNRSGSQICFDSASGGRRAMYIVDGIRE